MVFDDTALASPVSCIPAGGALEALISKVSDSCITLRLCFAPIVNGPQHVKMFIESAFLPSIEVRDIIKHLLYILSLISVTFCAF